MKEININNYSDVELRELRKEINERLNKPDKGVKTLEKKFTKSTFTQRPDLTYNGKFVKIKDYQLIDANIVKPIFTLLDYALGNYYCSGFRNGKYARYNTPIIRRHQDVRIKNEKLYEEMKNDLYKLILKYNKKAMEEVQNDI